MNRTFPTWPVALLAAGGALLLAGAAFAGWLHHGPEILLSVAERGLSWCF